MAGFHNPDDTGAPDGMKTASCRSAGINLGGRRSFAITSALPDFPRRRGRTCRASPRRVAIERQHRTGAGDDGVGLAALA
jgi:hypothetical protein